MMVGGFKGIKSWSSFFRQVFSLALKYSICGTFGWLRDKQGIESKCDPISCWVAQSMTDLRNLTKNFNLRRTNQPISSNIQYTISNIQYPISNIQYPISNIQYHPISRWVAKSMRDLRILESYKKIQFNPLSTIRYLISSKHFQEKYHQSWR